jgi:hypothetical protein
MDTWKAMYRRMGLGSSTYRMHWDAVFDGGHGE